MEDLRGGLRCGAGGCTGETLYGEVFSARIAAADGGTDCESAHGAREAASRGELAGARDARERLAQARHFRRPYWRHGEVAELRGCGGRSRRLSRWEGIDGAGGAGVRREQDREANGPDGMGN